MNLQVTSRTQTRQTIPASTGRGGRRRSGARPRIRYALCAALLLTLLAALAAPSRAQSCSSCNLNGGSCEKVKVSFTGSVCSTRDFTITFNGKTVNGAGRCTADTWVTTEKTEVELTVDKVYQLVAGSGSCATHIVFDVPEKYRVEVNGVETKTIDAGGTTKGSGDGAWDVVVRKCDECEKNEGVSQCDTTVGSVNWSVSLGKLSDGRSAQAISIREDTLSSAIYTPAALTYTPPRSAEIDVVRAQGGSLRQIKVPRALADVVVISGQEYEVRFYDPANVGAKTDGLYAVSGQPFVTWRVKNPDPSSLSRLQVSEIQGGVTTTSEYAWDAVTNSWSLSESGGSRVETKTVSYLTAGSKVETTIVKDLAGQVISKFAYTYHTFGWGDEVIEAVIDPDGAALKTTFSYYENPAEAGRYRKLKSITHPTGGWEKYDYDGSGNRTLVMRPWKDLSLASATADNSHTTTFTYSNSDGIKVSPYTYLISSVTERIAGTVVRKTTYSRTGARLNGEPATVETETTYASPTLTRTSSVTTYHPTASAHLANKVAAVVRPDGTKDTFTYERGDFTPSPDPALSQFTPNPNGTAWRETVVHGTSASPDGVPSKTTKETTVRDQHGHAVMGETYVYTGAGYERFAWTAMDYDGRGNLTRTRLHNGEVLTSAWSGGRKTSAVDATGVETVYTYDEFGRVKTETKKGVAAGAYPAQPDVTTTYTYDAEDRLTGKTMTGGGFSLSKSTVYDGAGRVKSETDTAGLTTSYSYSNGGRTVTAARPGGATDTSDSYLDGQVKSVAGTSLVARHYDYGVNADGTRFAQEFKGPAGLNSPRWTKTTTDALGRLTKVEEPGFTGAPVVRTSAYNSKGQLVSRSVSGGPARLIADVLYEYDDLGREVRAGLDVDANGALAPASADRVVEHDYFFQQDGPAWFDCVLTTTYLIDNDPTRTDVQKRCRRLNSFASGGSEKTVSEVRDTDEVNQTTIHSSSVDRDAKKVTDTVDAPDSNVNAVSVTVNGLLQSSAPTRPQSATTYAYDGLGRLTGVTDPRVGTIGRAYHTTTGQLTSESDAVRTTDYEYYLPAHSNAGRLKSKKDALGKKTYFGYNSRGEMVRVWGDAEPPVEYVYDDYGQTSETRTFRGGQNWGASIWPSSVSGAADVTRWIYHEPTGLLERKRDAAGRETSYGYDTLGRIASRTWARLDASGSPLSAAYSYDPATGDTAGINYSDSTPDVTLAYDRGGRARTITDASGTRARTFNQRGELQTEQISGGILDLVSVNTTYDSFQRRQFAQAVRGAAVLVGQTYNYDAASRLETIAAGSQTVTYGYHPASGMLVNTSFTGGTGLGRSYDAVGRLQTVTTTPAAGPAQSYAYTYNGLHQRTRVTREDGSYWSYGYNDRGELTSGKKFWSDGTPVFGQQTEYAYDNAGNRTSAREGGNPAGGLRQSAYAANALNQYAQRTVPGAVDVAGTANSAATVTVNGGPTARRGEYFFRELAVDNGAAPALAQINVVGARSNFGAGGEDAVTEKGGRVFVPQAVETFTHDADGNLTSDGRWNYTWDAEGRLVAMEAKANVPAEARLRLEFAYDWVGRRIQKKVYAWDSAAAGYQLQSVAKFVYDGRNLMAELDGAGALVRSYVWGQDASGTLEGAGGVGGLLLVSQGGSTYHVGYDGGGNVTTLVNAATGAISASYDYDPFGNTLKAVGDFAASNPFRFSTKYADAETGLLYYGYRYYQPQTGRWLSRDPLGEAGGMNLYGFVGNNPVSKTDPLGLYEIDVHYYLTLFLALQTGCFDLQEAKWVAEGNQQADEHKDFKPAQGEVVPPAGDSLIPSFVPYYGRVGKAQRRKHEEFHALTNPKNHPGNLAKLMGQATLPKCADREGRRRVMEERLRAFGRYLHYAQDMFSHEGFHNKVVGHGYQFIWGEQHEPDKTHGFDSDGNSRVAKAERMVDDTWAKLKQYGKDHKCCNPEDTNLNNTRHWVRQFLEADGGKDNESIEKRPELLENKRRLLRVVPKR